MNIAMLSTEAEGGGAARAMQRLALALRLQGHTVDLFVATAGVGQSNEILVKRTDCEDETTSIGSNALDNEYVYSRRTSVSNTLFSTQIAGFDLTQHLQSYDIVNVHWTGYMMSPVTLGKIAETGLPICFTLHDMAHFTGGCHYSAGCRSYEQTCTPCHQLSRDELQLTFLSLSRKRESYRRANVVAVAPSAWLAHRAEASGVFLNKVHVIWNSVETEIFRPADKTSVRQQLGIPDGTKTILFGVYDQTERRKGFSMLLEVLNRCTQDPYVSGLIQRGKLQFLAFGKVNSALKAIGVPFSDFGWVDDDSRLSEIYAAADLLVLPSIEDNQPNVMLEAFACGTPIVAFDTGGIPETVHDGINGRIVPRYDIDAMMRALSDLLEDDEARSRLTEGAAVSGREFSLERQGLAYAALFEETVSASPARNKSEFPPLVQRDETGRRLISAPVVLDPAVKTGPVAYALEQKCLSSRREKELVAERVTLAVQLAEVFDEMKIQAQAAAEREQLIIELDRQLREISTDRQRLEAEQARFSSEMEALEQITTDWTHEIQRSLPWRISLALRKGTELLPDAQAPPARKIQALRNILGSRLWALTSPAQLLGPILPAIFRNSGQSDRTDDHSRND